MKQENTHVIRIDDLVHKESQQALDEAAALIRAGELVAFPTETVYGLGANGLDDDACKKIFEAKRRPADNPLILHVSSLDEVDRLVRELTEEDRAAMRTLWPGPMTLIFKKSEIVPDAVTAGGDTVAIRFPSHEMAKQLIRKAGVPIAAPSANRSGRPSPTNAEDVYQDMQGIIPMILDGGNCDIGIESTVIDRTVSPPVILRPGFYTQEFLEEYMPGIQYDSALIEEGQIPKSPGQKYKHYAPKAAFTVFVGKHKPVYREISEAAKTAKEAGKKVGVMTFEEDKTHYDADIVLRLGSYRDITALAKHLFASLRLMDRADVDVIYGAGVDAHAGYGISIMNRMRKAASGRVIEVVE